MILNIYSMQNKNGEGVEDTTQNNNEDADYINSIMSELLRGGRNGRLSNMKRMQVS